jgi:hypothetical protein
MSLSVIRVDLFDDEFGEITLTAGETRQIGFTHNGFDNGHWVMCSVKPIKTSVENRFIDFTGVEIVRQWQNIEGDGSQNMQVVFHNVNAIEPVTFTPRFLVAPSLG